MIPAGWKQEVANDLCSQISVGIVVKPAAYYVDEASGVRAFRSANVGQGFVKDRDWIYISEEGHRINQKSALRTNDVLIVRTGYPGTACLVPPEYEGSNCIDIIFARPKPDRIVPSYLCVFTNSEYGKKQVLDGQGGLAQKHFNVGAFKEIKIPLPPLPEQRRIAEILSTWDRAIETLEALIANARTQKQALMQSLLTGKKRLPGFSGGWATVTLDKAAHIIVSNVDKKSSDAERSVRLCNYMDVYRSDRIEADMDFMVATAADAQIRKFGLRVGDVLITKDSETPDDIAIPSYVASTAPDLVCGYHLAIIRPRNGTDGLFLKFYFEHPHTRHFFASRANGATRFGLTIDAIQTAPIALPSYDEQKRIGEVIGAAELEIARLHPIAAALRQEKAALMQQLLSGKRRVKVHEQEPA